MKRKFVEVRNDYTCYETKNIAIDAYPSDDDNVEGRTVCWISLDGEIIKGTNPTCESDDFECELVKEAIAQAKEAQEEVKQKIVDDVIEDIKKSLAFGDETVIDDLLKRFPASTLIQSLPEEKWNNYF